MSNKFKKFQIDALEDSVEQYKHDRASLKKIDSELAVRRIRSRNTALRSRIKQLLLTNC